MVLTMFNFLLTSMMGILCQLSSHARFSHLSQSSEVPQVLGLPPILVYHTMNFQWHLLVACWYIHGTKGLPLKEQINQEISLKDSPYWEYILREFVFKTVFSPVQSNNALYKKLLDAPFYGGPLPTPSNEDNALLSRGNVYHLPDGRWILCQEGCKDCKPCSDQRDSLVKWTLKRIKRFISPDSYRHDLQLTIAPQITPLSGIRSGNYIYVPHKVGNTTQVELPAMTTTERSHVDRTRSGRSWRRLQRSGQLPKNQINNTTTDTTHPMFTLNQYGNITQVDPTHRLIMGIDQSGKKHVIHVLTIDPFDKRDIPNIDNHLVNAVRLGNTRGPTYQQYVKKVLDSIHAHRPIIEDFLTSRNKMKKSNPAIAFYPIYSEFVTNDTRITN